MILAIIADHYLIFAMLFMQLRGLQLLTDKVGIMKNSRLQLPRLNRTLTISTALFAVIITAALAFGHGGKHSDQFTHLQALQKATQLFDQLVTKGKLDKNWETDLQNVAVSKRNNKGNEEIVVAFQRATGDPTHIYIFFTSEGKYAGSNFTGEWEFIAIVMITFRLRQGFVPMMNYGKILEFRLPILDLWYSACFINR